MWRARLLASGVLWAKPTVKSVMPPFLAAVAASMALAEPPKKLFWLPSVKSKPTCLGNPPFFAKEGLVLGAR